MLIHKLYKLNDKKNKLVMFLMLILAGISLSQCATPRYHSQITDIYSLKTRGVAYNPEQEAKEVKEIEKSNKRINKVPKAKFSLIKIYHAALPKGITFNKEDNKLELADDSNYRVVGKAKTTGPDTSWIHLDRYNEEDNWRNYYCKINVPIAIATLVVYQVLVPTTWLCMKKWPASNSAKDISIRKKYLFESLQRTAHTLGGDAVIILEVKVKTVLVNKQTKEVLSQRTIKYTKLIGWVLKYKKKKETITLKGPSSLKRVGGVNSLRPRLN